MTTVTETAPERLATGDADGLRCILCDRVWPKDVMPLWHHYIMPVMTEATPPGRRLTCSCGNNHREPTWHAFDFTYNGHLVVTAMVCPECIPIPGLGAAVNAALSRELCRDAN